jgi:hypothetical protein
VGGIISLWWAASFRYGGRHHLVTMGGLDRNQHASVGFDWRIIRGCLKKYGKVPADLTMMF